MNYTNRYWRPQPYTDREFIPIDQLPCGPAAPRLFKEWLAHIKSCPNERCRRVAKNFEGIARDIKRRAQSLLSQELKRGAQS